MDERDFCNRSHRAGRYSSRLRRGGGQTLTSEVTRDKDRKKRRDSVTSYQQGMTGKMTVEVLLQLRRRFMEEELICRPLGM